MFTVAGGSAHLGRVDPELLASAAEGTDLIQNVLVGLDRHARRLQVLRRRLSDLLSRVLCAVSNEIALMVILSQ